MILQLRNLLSSPPAPAGEFVPFSGLTAARVPRLFSLAMSAATHVLIIVLIAVISRQMAVYFKDDEIDWSNYRLEPLRLHLAEPLFFRGSTAENVPATAATPKPSAPNDRRRGISPVPGGRPANLELPPPRATAKVGPVILQPEFHPQATLPKDLPPLAFWARQNVDLPKLSPKEVLLPGRTEEPSPPSKLGARPVNAVPSREKVIADVNVSLPETQTHRVQALPVANSATLPIRMRNALEIQTATFDPLQGQPANVLALAAEPRTIRDVQISRGLQNIPNAVTNSPAAASGMNSRSPGPDGKDAAARDEDPGGKQTGAQRTDSSTGSPGTGSQASNPMPESNAITLAKNSGTTGFSGTSAFSGDPKITRIHPVNGKFDIVIMQSAVSNEMPEAGSMLTGSPVYTVYLQVGDQKEWLLQYCIPETDHSKTSAYQINVDDATPVTPPYPISTAIPSGILAQAIPKPIGLYGLLTTAGILRMKEPQSRNPLPLEILTLLNEWLFRPAVRNNKPVNVEVLLVIPSRS